jgi:tetratricopeptide (TPR) repeat protein
MKRARRGPQRAAPIAKPRPARRRGARALAWAVAIVLVAATAFVALRPRPAATPIADEPSALSPEVAYTHAVELGDAGLWRASLGYYRRALAGSPGALWAAHLNYANSLNNITIAYVERAGHSATLSRSSVERVELGREAMAQMQRAADLAPDGPTRAMVLARLANLQIVWGFRWETYRSLRAAAEADPAHPQLAERAETFLEMLRDPTGFQIVQGDVTADHAPHAPR